MTTRKGKILQWCPSCRKMVMADLRLSYDDCYMLMADRSTCECGRVLWDWEWTPVPAKIVVEIKPPKQMKLF